MLYNICRAAMYRDARLLPVDEHRNYEVVRLVHYVRTQQNVQHVLKFRVPLNGGVQREEITCIIEKEKTVKSQLLLSYLSDSSASEQGALTPPTPPASSGLWS